MAALDAEAPLPSTSAVLIKAALCERDRALVLRLLNHAAGLGQVEKLTLEGMRCRFWRS